MAQDGREVFVGIDVGKARLDVHIRPLGEHFVVGNDEAGLAQLATRLEAREPRLIVLEASGGYERLAAIGLLERGLPVAVVNPRQTRKFAAALGQLAKTDRIDAAMLAHFAEAIRPAARAVTDDAIERLQTLLARRRQLVVTGVSLAGVAMHWPEGISPCGRRAVIPGGRRWNLPPSPPAVRRRPW
jgi:transposase